VIAARDLIAVLPQTTGKIKQILVEAGDVVKTGQVMAVLDNSVLQAELNQPAEVESNQAVVRQTNSLGSSARASKQKLNEHSNAINSPTQARLVVELDTRYSCCNR